MDISCLMSFYNSSKKTLKIFLLHCNGYNVSKFFFIWILYWNFNHLLIVVLMALAKWYDNDNNDLKFWFWQYLIFPQESNKKILYPTDDPNSRQIILYGADNLKVRVNWPLLHPDRVQCSFVFKSCRTQAYNCGRFTEFRTMEAESYARHYMRLLGKIKLGAC